MAEPISRRKLTTITAGLAFGSAAELTSADEKPKGGGVLAGAEVIAFVGTTDPARARGFYQDRLGLRLISEDPQALVFDSGGTMLRVSTTREVPPARYTVLGWKVKDIGIAIEALVTKGVSFERFPGFNQDGRGVWTTPDGARIAWFRDPDGNLLSLTQFPSGRSGKKR